MQTIPKLQTQSFLKCNDYATNWLVQLGAKFLFKQNVFVAVVRGITHQQNEGQLRLSTQKRGDKGEKA